VQQPGEADVVDVVAGLLRARTRLPPARDAGIDEPRIAVPTFSGSKPEPFGNPWAKSFEQDVRPVDESPYPFEISGGLEVGDDYSAVTQYSAAPTPGALHTHDLGTEVGKHHGGVRTRTHTGQLDDLHPGQRTSGHSLRTV
jgi:hypothetical protein